ncbi:hypothetical protein E2C01_032400 [Portunus trituberculatus]|uniref:Uncharacterized protein n=1 Tax=Portunus trituberculatus TaxID=210409 RepID=A0A5B7F2N4_PORTR|nr:hypothetical protein [Portunus trituberculatus]
MRFVLLGNEGVIGKLSTSDSSLPSPPPLRRYPAALVSRHAPLPRTTPRHRNTSKTGSQTRFYPCPFLIYTRGESSSLGSSPSEDKEVGFPARGCSRPESSSVGDKYLGHRRSPAPKF